MESILSTFGIDWRLLLVNAVNFGLLLLGLWYFLYGPVMRMLEERRAKITEGVAAAESARRRLAEIEASRAAQLAAAGQEADAMLAAARRAGAAKEREMLTRAESAADGVRVEAAREAAELKREALEESKREAAKLIVLGVEKLTR